MDRSKLVVLLAGVAVGAASTALAFVVPPLFTGIIVAPQDRPLEFGVSILNTTYGWFYRVVGLESQPRPLLEYSARFFVLGPPDYYGNQVEIVHFEGPLPDLVGASGNFSFEDRGIHLARLDAEGDYFWARGWHDLNVYRSGQLVGGTVACL